MDEASNANAAPLGLDEAEWDQIASFLDHLPAPVMLHIWGDESASWAEAQAVVLARALAERFERVSYRCLPRRVNYAYYPVVGVMGLDGAADDDVRDDGVRLIGLPRGYQITALIGAIQAVAFRGHALETATRIQLHRLRGEATLELLTGHEDEAGAVMAGMIANMAASNPGLRAYIVMTDQFPEAAQRHSVQALPHLVINGRHHFSGLGDEGQVLAQIARAT